MTTDQENELRQLIREIVELHEERGGVLTIHIENLSEVLEDDLTLNELIINVFDKERFH